jgi:murein L,D-transpeptidase YafK
MTHKAGPRPNLIALLLAALAFLCLPALLAFAEAESVPSTRRSDAAYARQALALERALAAKGLQLGAPVYLRLTKSPAELTAYVEDADGAFTAFRTWPVCSVSGSLGPKTREGDGQAPEGFYRVTPAQMNPASSYHLSFNLGYPNAYDRAHDRTGSFLMVHGSCVSIGCFAMTDEGIEEIWTLMQAAFEAGQRAIDVHIFPFPMTPEALEAEADHPYAAFWANLAPAWTQFAETARVPRVRVVGKAYEVLGVQ